MCRPVTEAFTSALVKLRSQLLAILLAKASLVQSVKMKQENAESV